LERPYRERIAGSSAPWSPLCATVRPPRTARRRPSSGPIAVGPHGGLTHLSRPRHPSTSGRCWVV